MFLNANLVRLSLLSMSLFLTPVAHADESTQLSQQVLKGTWLVETNGSTMINPQTSGLKYADGFLYSLSDGSAHDSQQRRLHKIDINTAKVITKYGPTLFSERVKSSCFYDYLAGQPDYEGMVALNDKGSEWIFVTEDARDGVQLSEPCQARYQNTHSTLYPTLLVKLALNGEKLTVEEVRPIQFPKQALVGDAANDGIEGLSLTKKGELLLGLEKDANNQARVFKLNLSDDFWATQNFAKVEDTKLLLPQFTSGRHPINGMDVYYPDDKSDGYLLAAARNDDKLWVIDLAGKKPTVKVPLLFLASSLKSDDQYCAPWHEMENASIEGVAVVGERLVLVNDPWKKNYHKNIVCEADRARYEMFSPLLFEMAIDPDWFG